MLRPATPLSVLLLVSFVLLLISTISAPVVRGIPLATYQGFNFGVFGFCKGDQCSGIRVGYTTDGLFGNDNNGDFTLSSGARHSLSALLIVHPIATFFNLVCLGLVIAAHFHSPSHSSRYLLGLLILLLPTLLVTLLAFLVDILIFAPHLKWAGWIVLASTILIAASGVVTCAMRRTLVARKARKRRIAENAEMSGENFYNQQALEVSKIPVPPPLTAGEVKRPMVNGAPGADALPSFTTFDSTQRRSDDDRRPLNSTVTSTSGAAVALAQDGTNRYGPPSRSRSQPPQPSYPGRQDEYGNPLPPSDAFGAGPGPSSVMRQRSEERRGPGPYRDDGFGPSRGGYPQRGRGGYAPRASYGPRGGYGGPRGPPPQNYNSRGGYSGPPQRGYSDRGRGGFSMGPMVAAGGVGMAAGAMMNRGPRQPPPGYPPQGEGIPLDQYSRPDEMRDQYQPQRSQPLSQPYQQQVYDPVSPSDYEPPAADVYAAYGSRKQSPSREQARSPYGSRGQSPAGGVRQPSPPPPMPHIPGDMPSVGKAVEMDANTGHMSPTGFGLPQNQLRDSDADVQGMVGLQQNRQDRDPQEMYGSREDEYIPPRAGWASAHQAATVTSNQIQTRGIGTSQQRQISPVELAAANSHVDGPAHYQPPNPARGLSRNRVTSGGSDIYYEDVPPQFATNTDPVPPMPTEVRQQPVPHFLQPGMATETRQFGPSHHEMLRPISGDIDPNSSYEDLQQGARSPAESETSNFTSVSQRGVNPNWRPGYPGEVGNYSPGYGESGMVVGGPGMMRKPVGNMARQQQEAKKDMLFSGNPDFEIPGMVTTRIGRGGGGVGGGMRGGGVQGRIPIAYQGAASSVGAPADGRYPTPGG